MKLKELSPIRQDLSDFSELEKVLMKLFRDEIYIPLIQELTDKKTLTNAKDDLLKAIQSGRISFYRGKFTGKLNATLSRELRQLGAEWDRKHGCFSIPQSQLSNEVRMAISLSESAFRSRIDRVIQKISQTAPDQLVEKVQTFSIFDSALAKSEKKFASNVKNISIAPNITPEMRARISAEYTHNLQLYIKDFVSEETVELRQKIEETVMSGGRMESVIGDIKKSYGVSQRKAKFLARQETNLMLTKYTQTRYESAGINEYKWQCRGHPKDRSPKQHTPGNVRYYHGLNDGKIFRWDTGAVVNEKGERKNPGQDYNCFCVAVPVVRF